MRALEILAELFAAFVMMYLGVGAVYMLRLSWESISIRFSSLFALILAWVLWPFVMWAEVGHTVKERARRRAHRISSQEYLAAVKRAYELQERQIMGRRRR